MFHMACVEYHIIQRPMTVRCAACHAMPTRQDQRTCLYWHRDYMRAHRLRWRERKVLCVISATAKRWRVRRGCVERGEKNIEVNVTS